MLSKLKNGSPFCLSGSSSEVLHKIGDLPNGNCVVRNSNGATFEMLGTTSVSSAPGIYMLEYDLRNHPE